MSERKGIDPLGPLPPRQSPQPSLGTARDTSPPRASPRLAYSEENAPDNLPDEGKTPTHFPVTVPYVHQKLKKLEEKQQATEKRRRRGTWTFRAVGGAIGALLMGALEHFHQTGDREREVRTSQQLKDHIDLEAGHYSETTKRLDQLLELELHRERQK